MTTSDSAFFGDYPYLNDSSRCNVCFSLNNKMGIYREILVICAGGFFFLFLLNVSQFKKSTGAKRPSFVFLLCLLGYIFLLPSGTVILLIFALCRKLISLILKIRYGAKFRGLLESADVIHTVEGSKSVINILVICEYDEKLYSQSMYDTARQAMYNVYFRDPERFPKFLYSFQKFMGYSYMLKGEVTLDDCVKRMNTLENKERLDREDVLRLITDCSNSPLPKNETVLWEVLIGTQAMNWNSYEGNNENKSYPILFRVHHGVADGVSLIKLMVGAIADNPKVKILSPQAWKAQDRKLLNKKVNRHSKKHVLKAITVRICKYSQNMLQILLTTIYVLCLAPTTFFQILLKANDRNILYSPSLSGQGILALNAEVSKIYVNKIRRIKDKIRGTTFSEVILTAFSATLDEYFSKNSSSCPRTITTTIPVVSGSSELKQLSPGNCDIDISLKNKFSLIFITLPLHVTADDDFVRSKPLIRRLKLLQRQTSALKNSIDYVVNHWVLSVALGLFPHFVVKFFMKLTGCATVISVLPGPPKLTFCGGSPAHDMAFWVPHMGQTGVSFSALTYDGRLQIGLNIDKALISDEKAAQSIVNGVYKYIDILDEETS